MTEARPSHLRDSDLPMPAKHLRLYSQFRDTASLLVFVVFAAVIIFTHFDTSTWREIVASALCLAQGLLYFFVIARGPRPGTRIQLTLYFVVGIGLWVLSCWLNPFLWWLGFLYFVQMFGLLPPWAVIAGSAMVTLLMILITSNWNPIQIGAGALVSFTLQWVAGLSSYLFVYSLMRTSHERAGLITRLEAAQTELELARQRDAELATLQERERLARDLHDSLGHALVAISVQLEAIQRLYKVDPERASAQVDELKTLTRASMDDLRRSLAGLRAPGLGERRLSEALQTLCAHMGQRAHLEVTCHIAEGADQLSPAQAEALWRVAQEALTNVERHASAHHVGLRLEIESQTALLSIEDDGHGLPSDAESRPGHYGLRGMRERIEGLGGGLMFSSSGQEGTRLNAKLPIL